MESRQVSAVSQMGKARHKKGIYKPFWASQTFTLIYQGFAKQSLVLTPLTGKKRLVMGIDTRRAFREIIEHMCKDLSYGPLKTKDK